MDETRFPEIPPPPRPLPAPVADEPPRLTARTLEGLEWLLARELEAVGATDLRIGRRTIEFSAPPGRERETLYRAVQEIDWTEQLKTSDTLRVDAAIHDTFLTHSLYAAQVVKDAVVDQLRTPSGSSTRIAVRHSSTAR